MRELFTFNSEKAPLTNFVGHQISKLIAAGLSIREKIKDPGIDLPYLYEMTLMREERHDYLRGNVAAGIGILAIALIYNTVR